MKDLGFIFSKQNRIESCDMEGSQKFMKVLESLCKSLSIIILHKPHVWFSCFPLVDLTMYIHTYIVHRYSSVFQIVLRRRRGVIELVLSRIAESVIK